MILYIYSKLYPDEKNNCLSMLLYYALLYGNKENESGTDFPEANEIQP
jgi:hypothetical protein